MGLNPVLALAFWVALLLPLQLARGSDCPTIHDIPDCVECPAGNCDIPTRGDRVQLFKNIDNNGSPIFDDGDGMRTVSYEAYGSNSINVVFQVTAKAPDRYRIFAFFGGSDPRNVRYYWLTGNNKGNGASCKASIPIAYQDVGVAPWAQEWDQVPDGQCY